MSCTVAPEITHRNHSIPVAPGHPLHQSRHHHHHHYHHHPVSERIDGNEAGSEAEKVRHSPYQIIQIATADKNIQITKDMHTKITNIFPSKLMSASEKFLSSQSQAATTLT